MKRIRGLRLRIRLNAYYRRRRLRQRARESIPQVVVRYQTVDEYKQYIAVQKELLLARNEAIEKAITSSIEHAKSYFSLVLAGGYAVFFGVWFQIQDLMDPYWMVWAAWLVGVSIFLFVLWYVIEMILKSVLTYWGMALTGELPLETWEKRFQIYQKRESRIMTLHMQIWFAQLPFSVLLGFAGVMVLMVQMLQYLV